jgi:hypothetical protein
MAYSLEGRLLEVCTCKTLCPCWVGDDPDGGTCDGTLAWHVDRGEVEGTDVSGLTIGMLAHIPGNILKGNWRAVAFIDDKATPRQEQALLSVFTGKQGGAIADLASLIGEVVSVERVPIAFEVDEGEGHVRFGEAVDATLAPFRDAEGRPTKLVDSIFSTIPGAPAFPGKASRYRAKAKVLGIDVELTGHNAVQGHFRFHS